MSVGLNVLGTNKDMDKPFVNVLSAWKNVDKVFVNVNGTWKEGWTGFTPFFYTTEGQSPSTTSQYYRQKRDPATGLVVLESPQYSVGGTYNNAMDFTYSMVFPTSGNAVGRAYFDWRMLTPTDVSTQPTVPIQPWANQAGDWYYMFGTEDGCIVYYNEGFDPGFVNTPNIRKMRLSDNATIYQFATPPNGSAGYVGFTLSKDGKYAYKISIYADKYDVLTGTRVARNTTNTFPNSQIWCYQYIDDSDRFCVLTSDGTNGTVKRFRGSDLTFVDQVTLPELKGRYSDVHMYTMYYKGLLWNRSADDNAPYLKAWNDNGTLVANYALTTANSGSPPDGITWYDDTAFYHVNAIGTSAAYGAPPPFFKKIRLSDGAVLWNIQGTSHGQYYSIRSMSFLQPDKIRPF